MRLKIRVMDNSLGSAGINKFCMSSYIRLRPTLEMIVYCNVAILVYKD